MYGFVGIFTLKQIRIIIKFPSVKKQLHYSLAKLDTQLSTHQNDEQASFNVLWAKKK